MNILLRQRNNFLYDQQTSLGKKLQENQVAEAF